MGFAWIGSLIVFSWAFFTLGRKYQDLQDVMLARRVARLIEQRRQVQEGNEMYKNVPEPYIPSVDERLKEAAKK